MTGLQGEFLQYYWQILKWLLKKQLKQLNHEILYYQGQVLSGNEFTYKLIHIHTNIEEMGKFLPYTESTCFFVSKYMADKCLKQL